MAEEGRTDKDIAEALHTSPSTFERTRRRFVEGGLVPALNESPRPGGRRKLTGKQEAYLVALACSDPPEGKKSWSMQMLADKLVDLEVVVDGISNETVRRTLKRGASSQRNHSGEVLAGVGLFIAHAPDIGVRRRCPNPPPSALASQ